MEFRQVERRKSKSVDDPFPDDRFVPWTRWLTVWDLNPGQWSISPDGELFKRLGERTIYETFPGKSVLQ